MAGNPTPDIPPGIKDPVALAYLRSLKESLDRALSDLQATQKEPYIVVSPPAVPVRTLDVGSPDLGDLTDVVATLIGDLKRGGTIR